jgi:hypothetical protein
MSSLAYTTVATIQNLEQETILKLENRTSETANIDRWLRDAIIELSGNPVLRDSFSELEELVVPYNLTGGPIETSVQEYSETLFLPIGPIIGQTTTGSSVGSVGIPVQVIVSSVNQMQIGQPVIVGYQGGNQETVIVTGLNPSVPAFTTTFQNTHLQNETVAITPYDYNIKTLDFLIWIDYPTNMKRQQLIPTQFQDSDKFNSFPSLPNQWYRFGNTIGFQPPPNKNYQVQARVMRRHPINDYFNNAGQLNTTPILLPAEWFEILEWSAAMRGFMELLEFEKAAEIRQQLWGDPAHPNDFPGLVASVKTKRRQEAWMAQQPLRPIIKASCWGNS